jgi:ATP-dependent protease HslVU (ClpYQ) peptidase subunit
MTVCIGAICEDGKSAVVAADKMVTFGPPVMLQTEPSAFKKITDVSAQCMILFSGSVPDGEEVLVRSRTSLAAIPKPTIAQIAGVVKNSYASLKKDRAEETILKPMLGVDFAQFQSLISQTASSQILQQFVGLIIQHNLQLDLLVVGVDDSGTHLYIVSHPGVLSPMDTIGFIAIGSGGLHAAVRMSLGKHTKAASLIETVHSVYEAKRAAEVAPGVGRLTDMAIIKDGKVAAVGEELLKKLETMSKEKPSLSQDEKNSLQEACDGYAK